MSRSIEMDDLTAKNNWRNMSNTSSLSGGSSSSQAHTAATSLHGSARLNRAVSPNCVVHMTPVEAIDPSYRMSPSNTGRGASSFVDYHRKFGLNSCADSADDDSGYGRRIRRHGAVTDSGGRKVRIMEKVIMIISMIFIIATIPISLLLCYRIVRHYQRLIVLRMGRIRRMNPMGPGTIFLIPCIDDARLIDMRVKSFDIKSTDIMLADSVQVRIEAVAWFRVMDPLAAVVSTDDFSKSTQKLTIGMIRRFLGYKSLTDVVSHEREFNHEVKTHINQVTLRFGVRIERIELKTIRLEDKFMATMAIEGTTHAREMGRSMLSQGELDSAPGLCRAADQLDGTGLSIRFMHSAIKMAMKSEGGKIVFPVPIDWDWQNLLDNNEKQRKVWLKQINRQKQVSEVDEKEKSI